MSTRIYQVTALAILIGAPIVVNLISNTLPGASHAAPASPEIRAEAPVAQAPETPPPPPPVATPPQSSADAVIDVTPAFDAHGISPDAISGETVAPASSIVPADAQPVAPPAG